MENKKKPNKVLSTVINIILWIFLIFACLMTVLAFTAQASTDEPNVPRLGGNYFFTVESDSMAKEGGFYKGDLIIGKKLSDSEKSKLKVNDVITFYSDLNPDDNLDERELNTHRIVEITEENGTVLYITKGDNNAMRDTTPVQAEDIKARWDGTRIPKAGNVIKFLQSSKGFLICIVLPLLLFFLYELYNLFKTIMSVKNKGKKQITEEEEELIKQRAVEEYLKKKDAETSEKE